MSDDKPRGPRRPSFGSGDRPRRSFGDRPKRDFGGERKPFRARESDAGGERKPFRAREGGDFGGERKPFRAREGGDFGGERKSFRTREEGGGSRSFDRPRGDYRPHRPKFERSWNSETGERPPHFRESRPDRSFEPRGPRTPPADAPTPNPALAYRWRKGSLQPIAFPHEVKLVELLCVEQQKEALLANTRQFVGGLPANHALLWGTRGSGKSTLVKALLSEFSAQGLRLVEVSPHDLTELPEIVAPLRGKPERFVLYVDDFSVGANDPALTALKTALDGGLEAPPDNVLIYATSNRRHLLPEYLVENQQAKNVDGEIHHGEAVEEKISLSERFGLWLSFYPFNQEQYLELVADHLRRLDTPVSEESSEAALRYALARGSRSGRIAMQFARDWAGKARIAENQR